MTMLGSRYRLTRSCIGPTEQLVEAGAYGYAHSCVTSDNFPVRSAARMPPCDVVLLGFRLPDSDDLSLVEGIRRLAPASALVMMTAYGTPQMIEAAKGLGVYEVIAKPFDVAVLEDAVVKAYQSKTT